MASASINEVPTASQVKPRERSVYVEAAQYTTLEENEIPRFMITPYPVSRDPSLSSTSTFRIMGMFCLVFSVVEMGISCFAYQYIISAGAYWSVIAGIIAGLSALFAVSSRVVLAVTITSIIGVPIAAFGCHYESQASRIVNSVTACGKHLGASGNFKTEYYGNEFYRSKVDVCVERMRQSMVFDFNFERYKTCMCSDAAGNCWNLVLNSSAVSPKDCGDLMARFPTLLVMSIAFAAISTFFMAALSISGILTLHFRRLYGGGSNVIRSPIAPTVNHLPANSASAILSSSSSIFHGGSHTITAEDVEAPMADVPAVQATGIPTVMCVLESEVVEAFETPCNRNYQGLLTGPFAL